MFLRRKFPLDPATAPPESSALPEPVRDVVANLNLLLATKRGIGHILPDFGFTRSGHWSTEGTIAEYTAELRENLTRYEPRLQVLEVDGEMGEDNRPELTVETELDGANGVWRFVIDLGSARVARVYAVT